MAATPCPYCGTRHRGGPTPTNCKKYPKTPGVEIGGAAPAAASGLATKSVLGRSTAPVRGFEARPEEEEAFTNGDCLFFAEGLAERTGGEVHFICTGEDIDEADAWVHAACKIDGKFWDINGSYDDEMELMDAYDSDIEAEMANEAWVDSRRNIRGQMVDDALYTTTHERQAPEVDLDDTLDRFVAGKGL